MPCTVPYVISFSSDRKPAAGLGGRWRGEVGAQQVRLWMLGREATCLRQSQWTVGCAVMSQPYQVPGVTWYFLPTFCFTCGWPSPVVDNSLDVWRQSEHVNIKRKKKEVEFWQVCTYSTCRYDKCFCLKKHMKIKSLDYKCEMMSILNEQLSTKNYKKHQKLDVTSLISE